MIAFWILLILSVLQLAFTAPVPVGEILEMRSNAVDGFKDGIAASEKRMDIDPGDNWSTNGAYRKDDSPGGDSDSSNMPGDDAPGSPNKDDMLGSELSWHSWDSEAESDARGPDPYYNDDVDLDFDVDEVDDLLAYNGAKSGDSNDGAKSDDSSNGAKSDAFTDGAKSDDHFGDGSSNDDTVQSGQAPAEEGPVSEHSAIPEYTTDLEKVLKSTFRPRNSGSGAVGTNRLH
jgi:hypothetical protein